MAVKLGVLALLEAKPGRGNDLAAFLQAGRDLAAAEDGTVTWYAFKASDTTYGIFDTFQLRSDRWPTISWRQIRTFGRSRSYRSSRADIVRS
jgi:hypothetical protein